MGMVLPIMLSYHDYKEHELDQTIKRKNKELREKEKKKYGCKYIWETQYQNFANHYHTLLGNMSVEKQ